MNTQKGFTLMELMITVVIVAILAAIAIPNYQSHMIRTRRATAATCLLELSQALERSHAINMTYTGFTLPVTQCSTDLSGHYSFSVANLTAQTYTLSAAPQNAQASNDSVCGTALTLNQAGQKSVTGVEDDASIGEKARACWR